MYTDYLNPLGDYKALEPLIKKHDFDLDFEAYFKMLGHINDYMKKGGDPDHGKISKHTTGLLYSILIMEGHFLICKELERIQSFGIMTYDIALDLSTNEPLFVKEYKDTGLNALRSESKRGIDISNLLNEYENSKYFNRPVLFSQRQPSKYYLAQPYHHEKDLFDSARDRKFTPHEMVEIYRMICDFISNLHKQGWLHRDIKLENFIVSKTRNRLVLHPIDYAFFIPKKLGKTAEIYLGTEEYINKFWLRDFDAGLVGYDETTDYYALTILLTEIIVCTNDQVSTDSIDNLYDTLIRMKNFPIDPNMTIPKLLGFAGQLETELNKAYRSNVLRRLK